MTEKLNIVIIDDHKLFLDGLHAILQSTNLYAIYGFNKSTDDILAKVAILQPTIIITDYNMPINSGIDVIKKLKSQLTNTKFIIVSVREDAYAIRQALKIGANAFLFKNIDKVDFLAAINKVVQGSKLYPALDNELPNSDMVRIKISEREADVLELLSKGLNVKEVANKLCISEYTVISHKKNLFAKTKTISIVTLVTYAIENGLV